MKTRTNSLADRLPVTAVRPDGLMTLDNGTLVRAVRLDSALAPLRMSDKEMDRTNKAVQEIPALLPDRQALQLITTARPFDWLTEIEQMQQGSDQLHSALVAEGMPERAEAMSRLAITGAEGLVQQADQKSAMSLEHLLIMPWRARRGAGSRRQYTPEYFEETVEDLDAQHAQIVAQLDTLGLQPQPLNGVQLLSSLYRVLNPGDRPTLPLAQVLGGPYSDPEEAATSTHNLRSLLCRTKVDDSKRTYLQAAGHVIQTRTLSSTPDHTWLGWLLHLTQSPYPFTLSVRWEAGSRARERSKAKHRYRRIYGMARSREQRARPVDYEEQQREEEARNLTAELAASAGAGVYQVSIGLSVTSPPEPGAHFASERERDLDIEKRAHTLERHMKALEEKILIRTDARLHLPWHAQMDAWRSTWPLGLDPLAVKRRYVTQNLADTIPIVSAHCGSPTGIPLGWERPGQTLARLDPYDPIHRNNIMIVSAPSGSGKTMATNLILGRMLPLGATGAIIDRAGHYEPLAKLVPGAVALNLGTSPGFGEDRRRLDPWRMDPESRPPAVNPWDVDDPREVPDSKLKYLRALHAFFLARDDGHGNYEMSPTEEGLLSAAIRQVYRECAEIGAPPREAILHRVLLTNAAMETQDGNPETASTLRRLADGLLDYIQDGSRAYLADWPTTVPLDAPLVIFDTRNVSDSDAGAAMCAIFEFQAAAAARAKERNNHRGPWGGRTFLIVDEGWKMLERESTGRWFNERARRSRHHGLFLVPISQQLTDFTDNKQGAALVSQSSMQLLFQQDPGQADFIAEHLKLSDVERETIANLKTIKGQFAEAYFRNGRRGSGLIEIRAGAAEYWYASSEPHYDQPLRAEVLERHNGDMWAALNELALEHAPLAA